MARNISPDIFGYIDKIDVVAGEIHITGWALWRTGEKFICPETLYACYKNETIHKTRLIPFARKDVAKAYEGATELCGFSVSFPASLAPEEPASNLILYAENSQHEFGGLAGPDGLFFPEFSGEGPNPEAQKYMGDLELRGVALSLTTNCNLRCVYCCINDGAYPFIDMDGEALRRIVAEARKADLREVALGLSGEPLVSKEFLPVVHSFKGGKTSLALTSNFARLLTDEEISALLSFRTIEVSIDTFESKNLKALRRACKLENIIYNIVKLNIARGRAPYPELIFNVIINETTARDFPGLVDAGIYLGVKRFEIFYMRVPVENYDMSRCPRSVDAAPDGGQFRLEIMKGLQKLSAAGIGYSIEYELKKWLFEEPENIGNVTRKCRLPFESLYVLADLTILGCSFIRIGKYSCGGSLKNIFNSARVKKIRDGLLTGKLLPECQKCSLAEPCTVEELLSLLDSSTSELKTRAFGDPNFV